MHINFDIMVVAEDLQCLKTIGLMGALRGSVLVSSQKIGELLGISPMTASRRLISLENNGLLTRSMRPDGQYVSITKEGEDELRREYLHYCRLFGEKASAFILRGNVIEGLGEGRYYTRLPGYVNQFRDLLDIDPYPGTLNLRLHPDSLDTRQMIDSLDWINIKGFTSEDRTFGEARALKCSIKGFRCAIIVPGRSHYPEDIVEIISDVRLRKELNLKNDDKVTVEVRNND